MNLESNSDLTSNLHHAFQDLEDPRATNSTHPLINIIVIALLAVIAGANDFTEFEEYGHAKQVFLARFLDLLDHKMHLTGMVAFVWHSKS